MNVGQHRRWRWKQYTHIFELVSLVLSLIISWTFRILAHEEDQYTDFLSIGLKPTKAGSQSLGITFLVYFNIKRGCHLSLCSCDVAAVPKTPQMKSPVITPVPALTHSRMCYCFLSNINEMNRALGHLCAHIG